MAECDVDGCGRDAVARGWCRPHWKKWRRNGSPTAPPRPRAQPSVADRFWQKVDKDGPLPPTAADLGNCWVWTASTDDWGYGFFRVALGETMRRAHRVSWSLTRGEISEGLQVLHHCDNPPCVRPEHLFVGDNADNVADRVSKDRSSRVVTHHGETSPKAKLDAAQVDEIRRRYSTGQVLQRELGNQFGVSQTEISRIVRMVRWNPDSEPRQSFAHRRARFGN